MALFQIKSGADLGGWKMKFKIDHGTADRVAANLTLYCKIGHVLNKQGTGYEHIFSWYDYSVWIELKMEHVI